MALNPAIAVLGARVHALRGPSDEAERWLELAELHGAGDPEVAAQVAVMRASFCRDGVGTMLSDAGSAVESLPDTSDWRSLALLVYAVAHTLLGDNERANELFGDAIIARKARRLQRDPGAGDRASACCSRRRHTISPAPTNRRTS